MKLKYVILVIQKYSWIKIIKRKNMMIQKELLVMLAPELLNGKKYEEIKQIF